MRRHPAHPDSGLWGLVVRWKGGVVGGKGSEVRVGAVGLSLCYSGELRGHLAPDGLACPLEQVSLSELHGT